MIASRSAFSRIVIALAAAGAASVFLPRNVSAQPASVAGETYGMKQYNDAKYGFSFWYPDALQVTAAATKDRKSFPGGVAVETLQVGPAGAVAIHVVNSPRSTITDEPNGHAAPIAQTKYFYDAPSRRWMVAYREGADTGASAAPAPADVATKTIGDLPMLPSGGRFDTTIIPLSLTRFIVVSDGGGSTFTVQLARPVAPAGAKIGAAALAAALQAEAAAFKKQ